MHVTATVTLGIAILTGPDAHTARDAAIAEHNAENTTGQGDTPAGPDEMVDADCEPCEVPACLPVTDPRWVRPAIATGGLDLGRNFSISAALISGCEIPGIGFIDADTIETLLSVVPVDIGRALLDARTGTLIETVTTAYRPPKNLTEFVITRDGTCRMWGCHRPATACDIDHARPWPAGPTTPTNLGGLCRRHHRLRQQRRWTYHLAPDGTATWTSPTGKKRITPPDFAAPPTPPRPPDPEPRPSPSLVDSGPPPF